MDPEREGKKGLLSLLDWVLKRFYRKFEDNYGPPGERSIPQEEIDRLVQQSQRENLSHSELAKRVYELKQKYPDAELPDEFRNFFDRE